MIYQWIIWMGPDGKIGESGPFLQVRVRSGMVDGIRPNRDEDEEYWQIGIMRRDGRWCSSAGLPAVNEFRVESRQSADEETDR
jgi:hypothetical protein